MLNGTEDPVMPERCARRLHERAGEPKTVRWVDVGHVLVSSDEFRRRILGELVDWLVDIDFIPATEAHAFLGLTADIEIP